MSNHIEAAVEADTVGDNWQRITEMLEEGGVDYERGLAWFKENKWTAVYGFDWDEGHKMITFREHPAGMVVPRHIILSKFKDNNKAIYGDGGYSYGIAPNGLHPRDLHDLVEGDNNAILKVSTIGITIDDDLSIESTRQNEAGHATHLLLIKQDGSIHRSVSLTLNPKP